MSGSLLIRNISRLVTAASAPGCVGSLGVIENACLRVHGGRVLWAGSAAKLPIAGPNEKVIDAKGGVVMPGLIDCHTHLVHAGWRFDEFDLRSRGKTYKEIAAAGGGIMSTVRATRAATFEELLANAKERAREAISRGVTSIEIKTGYGLDLETEIKIAEVILALKRSLPIHVTGTFLGAHVVPLEYKGKRGEYLKLVIEKMLPAISMNKAFTACDIFIEDGAFTSDEARKIASAAKGYGLRMRLHADQFTDGDGGNLAAEFNAISADHLDRTTEKGLHAMAKKGVSAVVLPGASFFAGRGYFPNVRKMIDLGLNVAIATDYNPGTNPSLDLWLMTTIAVTQMGLSCDEAILGITKNAAKALGVSDAGTIEDGKRADILILDAPHEHFPLYRYGTNFVRTVIANGDVVYEKSLSSPRM